MGAVAASFAQFGIKAVCFIAIAYAGIIVGKKYRDSRDNRLKNIVSDGVSEALNKSK